MSGADLLKAASGLSSGSAIGGAIAGLFAPNLAAGVEKKVAENRTLIAGINAKRSARELRYAQGLAVVQNAAAGRAGGYGSVLFAMADDARKKEEAIQGEYLQATLANSRAQASLPSKTDAAFNLVGTITSAYGQSLKTKAALLEG